MRRSTGAVAIVLTLAGLTAGCSTPRPILDVARKGAATVGLAEISLRNYVDSTNAQLSARAELVRQDSRRLAQERATRQYELFIIDDNASTQEAAKAQSLIQKYGDAHRKARQDLAAELANIDKSNALDTSELATVPTDNLSAAKKGFGVLAQELSATDWVRLTSGYAKEIVNGLKQLKDKKESEQ